jgi:hypothetical protein
MRKKSRSRRKSLKAPAKAAGDRVGKALSRAQIAFKELLHSGEISIPDIYKAFSARRAKRKYTGTQFASILNSRHREELCVALVEFGSMASKAYGLFGLYLQGSSNFAAYANQLTRAPMHVSTGSRCSCFPGDGPSLATVSEIIACCENIDFDGAADLGLSGHAALEFSWHHTLKKLRKEKHKS